MSAQINTKNPVNVTTLTQEQIAQYNVLIQQKEKAAQRAKAYREQNKEKSAAWSERARVRSTILVRKAKEAGLTVSEKEVDEYLAKMNDEKA